MEQTFLNFCQNLDNGSKINFTYKKNLLSDEALKMRKCRKYICPC